MKRIGAKHLEYLTDDFGIWQHTDGNQIDRTQGYALDDAARALLTAVELIRPDLADVYISFIERSVTVQPTINFYTADRQPWDRPWSPDALAECYWALAVAISNDVQESRCRRIIETSIAPKIYELREWLRASAYLTLGAALIDQPLALELADQLLETYRTNYHTDWPWPEDTLYYANAILPYALLEVGRLHGHVEASQTGERMLKFLNGICLRDREVHLIGNEGWYSRGGLPARYGEQPIEAAYSVLANVSAYAITHNEEYLEAGGRYLNWFWGENSTGEPIINLQNESVADGIDAPPRGISQNQGAENIVCYLYAQEQIWPLLKRNS